MQSLIRIGNNEYILFEKEIWFSQLQIAKLFNKSIKTINGHIKDIKEDRSLKISAFDTVQQEGGRQIKRKKLHYNFHFVYAIGIKAREYAKLNELSSWVKDMGFEYAELSVMPVKEREFVDLVLESLDGVCTFEKQFRVGNYRLDLYSEELKLAIEYDEKHHMKPMNKVLDVKREAEIRAKGISVIRVREGEERQGLNRIIKHVIMRKYAASNPQTLKQ